MLQFTEFTVLLWGHGIFQRRNSVQSWGAQPKSSIWALLLSSAQGVRQGHQDISFLVRFFEAFRILKGRVGYLTYLRSRSLRSWVCILKLSWNCIKAERETELIWCHFHPCLRPCHRNMRSSTWSNRYIWKRVHVMWCDSISDVIWDWAGMAWDATMHDDLDNMLRYGMKMRWDEVISFDVEHGMRREYLFDVYLMYPDVFGCVR